MFEITYKNTKSFGGELTRTLEKESGSYDFTFENRFDIFHCSRRNIIAYIALDDTTGLTSEVMERTELFPQEDFQEMIPAIINAIKYTGDERHKGAGAYKAPDLFDYIFRIIMPRYGFTVREQQVQMANVIFDGLVTKKATLCEAEVGSGKTMAYLVAGFAAKLLDESYRFMGHPVTITTSSIELQKAIVEKEVPKLSRMLMDYGLIFSPLTAVLRKGREHYFCRRRYYEYLDSLFLNPLSHVKTINTIQGMNLLDTALDLDPLPMSSRLKARLCVKGSCHDCPRSGKCRYMDFLNEASSAYKFDFQITNHNLFLTAQKNRQQHATKSGLIPSNYCIVDEAHKLLDATADVFGAALTFSEVEEYLNAVKHNGGYTKRDRTEYAELLRRARYHNTKLLSMFSGLAFTGAEDVVEQEVQRTEAMKDTMEKLSGILHTIGGWTARPGGVGSNTADYLTRKLSVFLTDQECKFWVSLDKTTGVKTLCCTPMEMKEALCKALWTQCDTHFALTSGTMKGGKDFDYFKAELGITDSVDPYLVSEFACESPFDYRKHTRLYISENVPYPDMDDPSYIPKLASEIVDLIRATGGHTAVLFTSYKALTAVYDKVAQVIHEYPLIKMSRSNKNAISQFKNSKNGVLFACGSMWEGVDCAGDILSSVIIVRLPFPVPTLAMDYKRAQCGSKGRFIHTFIIPQMILKLRQGAGRLVRTESDTGVLAILDCRAAVGGRYRSQVLKTLRKYPLATSIQEVSDFMHDVKDDGYWEGVVE